MLYSQIKRTMVETVVRRGLEEIQRDPKRSIRKLVDLGMEASAGALQRHFMQMFQEILKNGESPYYQWIRQEARLVEHERLVTFGMNLGWNSLTQGAARIRELEALRGHNIPWSITFHMEVGPGCLTHGDYIRLVLEGMELGIYSYFLLPRDAGSVKTALDLASASRNCAFFLMLPQGYGAAGRLEELAPHKNILLGVDCGAQDWEADARALRDRGLLYGLHYRYGVQDTRDICTGQWMERVVPHAGIAVLLEADEQVPQEAQRQVYRYTMDSRMGQRYPMLLMDFYPDNLYVDILISEEPCFVGVLPDGTMTGFARGREQPLPATVRQAPLEELLKCVRKA